MTPDAEALRAALGQIDSLRDALVEQRRASPYPWDPSPIAEFNALLERVRTLLPGAPVRLPPPLTTPSTGRLWRTPTEDALDALEALQAAIATALKAT